MQALFQDGFSDAGTRACFEGDTTRLLSSGSSSHNFCLMKLERESTTVFGFVRVEVATRASQNGRLENLSVFQRYKKSERDS